MSEVYKDLVVVTCNIYFYPLSRNQLKKYFSLLFRDTFVYAASADSRGLDPVVKILGEVVLRPQISLQEVKSDYFLHGT